MNDPAFWIGKLWKDPPFMDMFFVVVTFSDMLHAWYIYLHLGVNIPYMEHMGLMNVYITKSRVTWMVPFSRVW